MKGSYSKNYLKIYLWRSLSIISGFLSMLIVVPHLSNNEELYGIYAFCISFTLYLTYADIGFLGAGQKYAAEQFARGNRNEEVKILGFTAAILLVMILPFSLGMIYLSFHPSLAIKNLSIGGQKIAGSIFLIIGILSPVQVILQRLVQSILIIRIKDYVSLRIDIVFNILKIFSVFFFFAKGKYMVVEYFLFSILLTILSSVIILFIIRRDEEYDFLLLLKSIRLSKKYYHILKKLAFSSLFLTLGWLIYYELDLIIVGKWFGPKDVAIYAIGLTFLNFLRTLWNTVFSPYAQRFNHFVGLNSVNEMKNLTKKIIDYTLPLCLLTTLVLILGAKYLVVFWVGNQYVHSIIILQLLVAGTAFGFVTQPASYYFMAKTKYHFINLMAVIVPSVFILGVVIFIPVMGIEAIALSKSLALLAGFLVSMIGISSLINPVKLMKAWLIRILIFSGLLILTLPRFLNTVFGTYQSKSTLQLILLVSVLGGVIMVSYLVILLTRKKQRNDLAIILNKLYIRFK